jgi:murein DD-endopeptidase MepM/ murein hydrolase activator NlpD
VSRFVGFFTVTLSFLTIFAGSVNAEQLTLKGKFVQGGMVFGQTEPGATVYFQKRTVRVSDQGEFVIGFGRDFKSSVSLRVKLASGAEITREITVEKRSYRTEHVDGLPASKVTPSAKFLSRIKRENGEIYTIRQKDSPEKYFKSGWIWPALGRVSGVYGSQRVLNGIPKRPHFGLDVAAPVGTQIVASTDGVVRLAKKDLYYTGGTVMIDHGHGLVSVYSHLSRVTVKIGAFVKQGDKIGEIGATGRASGPHLDWRLNWFNERLDPRLLLGPMPGVKS